MDLNEPIILLLKFLLFLSCALRLMLKSPITSDLSELVGLICWS
uniref:Uncharacterized protein n=1 Tax=Triticum urartu TaxID=4572 RepID=A0A8R7TGS7_TRIUA